MTVNCSTNRWATSNYIVAPTIAEGAGYTTIAAAIAAAPANSTIFIKPGIYTENLTLSASVNLVAFPGDETTPNVTIVGKATATFAGSCSITGIRLQTNSDFALVVSGSSATIVYLDGCYLRASNNTFLSVTSSSASANVFINNCSGDIGTTGISLYANSSPGALEIRNCRISNSGNSTTASSTSAGTITVRTSTLFFPLSTSGASAVISFHHSIFNTSGQNATALTHDSTVANCIAEGCRFASGTASAISLGAGVTLQMASCNIASANATTIAGTGTIQHGIIDSTLTTLTIAAGVTDVFGTMLPGAISFDKGVNKLQNYEKGTWTPTVDSTNSDMSGQAYSVQVGRYTRIGNTVSVSCNVAYTATAGTGALEVNGLPFTVLNTANYAPKGAVQLADLIFPGISTYVVASGILNDTRVLFTGCTTNTSAAALATDAGGTIIFSLVYEV